MRRIQEHQLTLFLCNFSSKLLCFELSRLCQWLNNSLHFREIISFLQWKTLRRNCGWNVERTSFYFIIERDRISIQFYLILMHSKHNRSIEYLICNAFQHTILMSVNWFLLDNLRFDFLSALEVKLYSLNQNLIERFLLHLFVAKF